MAQIISGCEQWPFCSNVDKKCGLCFRNRQHPDLDDLFEKNETAVEVGYELKWTKEDWLESRKEAS